MYLRWLLFAFVAAALVGGVIAACGGDNTPPTCTTDANCSGGQVCHPTARQCVKTCNSSSDCPNNQNSCATFTGLGADGGVVTTAKICQCTDDNMCAGGSSTGSSSICNNIDKICQTKCSSSSNCASGRTCNTTTGQCGTGTCTKQGTCTSSGTICNFGNGICESPKSCSISNPQPDACSYGQFCSPNCQEVPKPSSTCPNFSTSAHGLAWGTGSTGPIIYSIQRVAITSYTSAPNFCSTTVASWTRFRVRVNAYTTSGTFPSTPSGIEQMLHLVDPSGSEINTSSTVESGSVTTSNGGKNVQFDVNFCRSGSGQTQYSAGMHFFAPGGGNEYCALIQ